MTFGLILKEFDNFLTLGRSYNFEVIENEREVFHGETNLAFTRYERF